MLLIRYPIILENILPVTVFTLAECYLWKVSLGTEDENKNVDDEDNLVLLDDVAGDVSGDRDILVQAQVDLDNKDNGAVSKDEEILQLFNKFQDPYFCLVTKHCGVVASLHEYPARLPLTNVYNKLSISGRGFLLGLNR